MSKNLDRRLLRRFVTGLFVASSTLFSAGGCAPKVEQRKFPQTIQVGPEEKSKVEEYLAKAGIKGEVTMIESEGEEWVVEVNPMTAGEPGKRPIPKPPQSYFINKATGKVRSGFGG
jgi:hypothetical protein